MPKTRIDLPQDTRQQVCDLLNKRLADLIDLSLQSKQAHWNVRGMNFIAIHEMFDKLREDVDEYVDTVAERVVQLGGFAEGTSQAVVDKTTLDAYPMNIQDSKLHLQAVSAALAKTANEIRNSIDVLDDFDDEGSEDVLVQVSRGLDKWLWFVSAHVDVEPDDSAAKSKAASKRK
jgi:starvation-inducible DNA-binding protein